MPESGVIEEVVGYVSEEGGPRVAVVEEFVGVSSEAVEGPAGPPGSQGEPGPPGAGTGAEEELEVTTPGAQSMLLAEAPIAGSASLFINGLRQRANAFTVVAETVTLPADLNLLSGDVVTVTYLY